MGSYAPPSIGSAGLTTPSYQSILSFYISSFLAIYGQNFNLGNSSPVYQLLSILALAASDANNCLQQTYSNMSPATAIGAGLSLLVLLNGLQRMSPSYSTCLVTLTGTAGAVISNGLLSNSVTGDLWALPASVTIGLGGTVTVIATAQVIGSINALANQLTVIVTPQFGWDSVTNGSNVPSVGTSAETDSALRGRQQVSTELPSETLLAGTIAAVLAVPGVTRINNSPVLGGSGTPSINNPTGSTDSWGNPAHSITVVVQGGTAAAVALAIYNNRGIGALTNGNVSGSPVSGTQTVNITDPNSGIVTPISFIQPPTSVPIFVIINAHPTAGGTLSAGQILAIQTGVVNYLNGLQIGETVSFGEMVQAASTAVNPNPLVPVVSIRSPFYFAITPSPSSSTDITIPFYEVASGVIGNIIVNSV